MGVHNVQASRTAEVIQWRTGLRLLAQSETNGNATRRGAWPMRRSEGCGLRPPAALEDPAAPALGVTCRPKKTSRWEDSQVVLLNAGTDAVHFSLPERSLPGRSAGRPLVPKGRYSSSLAVGHPSPGTRPAFRGAGRVRGAAALRCGFRCSV